MLVLSVNDGVVQRLYNMDYDLLDMQIRIESGLSIWPNSAVADDDNMGVLFYPPLTDTAELVCIRGYYDSNPISIRRMLPGAFYDPDIKGWVIASDSYSPTVVSIFEKDGDLAIVEYREMVKGRDPKALCRLRDSGLLLLVDGDRETCYLRKGYGKNDPEISIRLPYKLKEDCSVVSLPGNHVVYFDDENKMVMLRINAKGEISGLDKWRTPIWSEVGGTEYEPLGCPVVNEFGDIFVMTNNKIMKFDRNGIFIKQRSIAGLSWLSCGTYNTPPDTLVRDPESSLAIGNIDVPINNQEFELVLRNGKYHSVFDIVLPENTVISEDGETWVKELVHEEMDPETETSYKIRTFPQVPGPSNDKGIIIQNGTIAAKRVVKFDYTAIVPDKISIPVRAVHEGAGIVEDNITITRVDGSDQALDKAVKVPVKANFI